MQQELLPKITPTPDERGRKIAKRIKKMLGLYADQESLEEIHEAVAGEIEKALSADRKVRADFITISQKEGNVLGYYLNILEKVRLMAGTALIENNRQKKEELLLEITKLLGSNVDNETTPVPVKVINKDIEEKVA